MRITPVLAACGAILTSGTAWLLSQSATTATLQNPPADATDAFLVKLGGTDTVETRWDGSVQVINGELVKLIGYEMRIGDIVHPPDRWEASTRKTFLFTRRPHDEDFYQEPAGANILSPRLFVFVRGPAGAEVVLKTTQGDFRFSAAAERQSWDNGKVIVQKIALPQLVGRGSSGSGRLTDNDYPGIAAARDGSIWVSWQGYKPEQDEVSVEQISGGVHRPHRVSTGPGDVHRTAVAQDGEGKIWVVWSARVNDNWDLYGRAFDGSTWGSIARLTSEPQPDTQHQLAADASGRLHLVWQGWRGNRAGIYYVTYEPSEGWSQQERVSPAAAGNCWEPSLAIDSRGFVHVAWDQYGVSGYDIWLRSRAGGVWHNAVPVAATPLFEAYASVAVDNQDRIWVAWHESGINWGKDWGYPYDIQAKATGLYNSRNIRIAVRTGSQWMQPATQLEAALPPPGNNFYEYPRLASDGQGRIHAFFRKRTPQQHNVYPRTPSHQALWEIYVSTWDGGQWSPMTLLPYSTGRHDMRLAAATDREGVLVAAWPTDRRGFRDMINTLPDVFAARLAASGPVGEQRLVPYQPAKVETAVLHADEPGDVRRIRAYEYNINGERLRIFRGDMHRHTEISWDGYSDGSTEDTYRYAIDAAAMDFLAVTEHNFGVEDEYDWWRSQKYCDLFRVGASFVPLYAYERSATYPNGHRNIVFTYRGAPVLDVQHYEWGDNPNNRRQGAERLFGYLRKYRGVAMPHTTATDMGTDWRDYDPEVEPVVEIYQSDRNSYECADCWRAAPPNEKKKQFGGYRPDGFVSKAWEKGYRLGVQASSDHLGVHTAYAMVLAPQLSREALVEAIRKRRTYGATDNIIVDFRLTEGAREWLMGSDAKIAGPARFRVHIEGTGPLRDVEIVKDGRKVYAVNPGNRVADFQWSDTAAPGMKASYYYVRVRQTDLQVAWGSPIWVEK
jgi:hypothetical protein